MPAAYASRMVLIAAMVGATELLRGCGGAVQTCRRQTEPSKRCNSLAPRSSTAQYTCVTEPSTPQSPSESMTAAGRMSTATASGELSRVRASTPCQSPAGRAHMRPTHTKLARGVTDSTSARCSDVHSMCRHARLPAAHRSTSEEQHHRRFH